METEHWLIYSREHNAFWRPNSAGYTPYVLEAGRYTYENAIEICNSGRDAQPDGTPSEVAVVAPEGLEQAAAQAREQALKGVEATIRALSQTLDDWSDGQADTANAAIDMALNQVASLTTPTAQAEVRKRIVAEWLEEMRVMGLQDEATKTMPKPEYISNIERSNAATLLLAVLKESE